MNTNQDKLRDAIEEIIDNFFTVDGKEKHTRELESQLLSLFNQEYKKREKELIAQFDEIIGEDSNISYHDEGNARILHQEAAASRLWEIGYNKAKAEQRQKLKALEKTK